MNELKVELLPHNENRDIQAALNIYKALKNTAYLMGNNKELYEDYLEMVVGRMDISKSQVTIRTVNPGGTTYRFIPVERVKPYAELLSFTQQESGFYGISYNIQQIDETTKTTYRTDVNISLRNGRPELVLEKNATCIASNPPVFPNDSCIKVQITDSEKAHVEEITAATIRNFYSSIPTNEYELSAREAVAKVVIPE